MHLEIPALCVDCGEASKEGHVDRRSVLKGLGGVMVLAAGGGIYRASDQGVFSVGEGPAYEPWHTWDADSASGPLAIVHAGVLAANPHNTQPWLFHVAENRIDLYADPSRYLGAMDYFGREMHIGLGCAIANMKLAAAQGYRASARSSIGKTYIKDRSDPVIVATLKLEQQENITPDPLFDQIPFRHTNRGPYDTGRPLDSKVLSEMLSLVPEGRGISLKLFADEAEKKAVGNTIVKATEAIVANHDMVMASDAWFRHDWDELQQKRDGVTLDAAGMPASITAVAKMLPESDPETGHEYWLGATRDVHVPTAAAYGVFAVRDLYSRPLNMLVGEYWQRLHLSATAKGLAAQPLNQPLEIFDYAVAQRKKVKPEWRLDGLFEKGWHPTFCFRFGYPEQPANASPRRRLLDVVRQKV